MGDYMEGITYKFNNYDKDIPIKRKEFFNPQKIVFYLMDGDSICVENEKIVSVNDLLVKKSNGVKYFSPISGIATIKGNSIIVTNDNKNTEIETEQGVLSLDGLSKEDIINTCNKYGINNGIKPLEEEFTSDKKILLLNTIDVEPYTFNNGYLLQENCKNSLELLNKIANLFDMVCYIAVSKYDPNLVSIQDLINNYPKVGLLIIKERYPYNSNLFIKKKYLNEYSDKETIEIDLITLYKLFVSIVDKKPLNERLVTVIFNDPFRYYLVKTYYGVYLQDMIDSFVPSSWGGKCVYLNNCLRNNKCSNFENLSLTDTVKTIFVLDEVDEVTTRCIKCGKCSDICPVKINPLDKKLDSSCIRCGLCNYICPSNINLMVRVKKDE